LAFLTCDWELAEATNLISTNQFVDQIQDLYTSLGLKLLDYIDKRRIKCPIDPKIFCTRKIMKIAFMPLVYGKTRLALAQDLYTTHLHPAISLSEAKQIAKIIYDFGDEHFHLQKLVQGLFSNMASFSANIDNRVLLINPNLLISQDYRVHDEVKVCIFNPATKRKKTTITLRIRTEERNPRKAAAAITANAIHALNAFVCLTVVKLFKELFPEAPIYTIHDCFVTSPLYVDSIGPLYIKAFLRLGSPIAIINQILLQNIAPTDALNSIDFNKQLTNEEIYEFATTTMNQKDQKISAKQKDKALKDIKKLQKAYAELMQHLKPEKVEKFIKRLQDNPGKYCVHI
jgi:DNA-directed RNA polymerase